MRYLDCGCCITDDGDRVWCPTCTAGVVAEYSPPQSIDWKARAEAAEAEVARLRIENEAHRSAQQILNADTSNLERLVKKIECAHAAIEILLEAIEKATACPENAEWRTG